MSLICFENGDEIAYGTPLMAGTRADVPWFFALSQRVLNRIPESEKRPTRCEPGDGGVDIHDALSSGRTTGGNYTLAHFVLKEFCYSLSRESAQRYLPKLAHQCSTLQT